MSSVIFRLLLSFQKFSRVDLLFLQLTELILQRMLLVSTVLSFDMHVFTRCYVFIYLL